MSSVIALITAFFLSLFSPNPKSISVKESSPSAFPPTVQPSPTLIPPVVLGLVGDLGLGRHITSTARSRNDFSWSFSGVGDWLKENDFNLANLESPIINDCPTGFTGTFTFCGDTRFLPQLVENKFVLSLANNHILNYGRDGLVQTEDMLDQNSLVYIYGHDPDKEFVTKTVNDIKFGFLSYDFITYPNYDKNKIIETVKNSDGQVDWLIVSLHWGNEYLPKPEAWRQKFGKDLVDAGADIIHGHHPHVWQPEEYYRGKPIFYSYGNFIFDQSWSYATSHSNIVRLTLTKNEILRQEVFPIEIQQNSRPVLKTSSADSFQ
ncbi:MAG: CapA family protein [Candidatus Shapirobacteria bacterium]|jgi:poly-gamma-glutamate synthesis protein (capsule biosynthesis protein)